MMFILGGLSTLCGAGMAAIFPVLDDLIATSPQGDNLRQTIVHAGGKSNLLVSAILSLAIGILYLTLAILVRSGKNLVVRIALIVNGLMGLNLLFGMVHAALTGDGLSALTSIIPIGLVGTLILFLVQAARNARLISAGPQQAGNAFLQPPPGYVPGGGGYGYGAPPAPPGYGSPGYGPPTVGYGQPFPPPGLVPGSTADPASSFGTTYPQTPSTPGLGDVSGPVRHPPLPPDSAPRDDDSSRPGQA